MATEKTDFLRFNAYSMKELITRKMSEDSRFTDQVYEGSNLAILIDLVAYMYQVLVYQLNNSASESMFSDVQVYENINRLVNLIGYHPKGCRPSQVQAYLQSIDEYEIGSDMILPPFSFIDTGLTDSNGKKIIFSIGDEGIKFDDELQREITLYNGQWRLYPHSFTSNGSENETFVLYDVGSDSDKQKYVANDFIKAIVLHEGQDTVESDSDSFSWTYDRDELFVGIPSQSDDTTQIKSVYNKKEMKYSIRLNQNKEYEIQFGDGIVGKKLDKGDRIFVFYLDTNGEDGNIATSDIDPERKFQQIQVNQKELKSFVTGSKDKIPETDRYAIIYDSEITKFRAEESVEDIRNNAPNWFKTGNRLITRSDYEYWVKNYSSGIIDVKCMNNWEYLTTFYGWLYKNGLKWYNDGRHFIDNNILTRYNCKYVDPADANNIYLWIKKESDTQVNKMTEQVNRICNQLKTITSEIEVLSPIDVKFDICAQNIQELSDFNINQVSEFGQINGEYYSYLEVTMSDNIVYVNSNLSRIIAGIIREYFNKTKCQMGQTVNLNDILNQIYSINGVSNVRTVCLRNGMDPNQARIIDGLSMASWSNAMIITEDGYPIDMDVSNISRKLEPFQFPSLNNEDELDSRIRVIKKQLANINTIKF